MLGHGDVYSDETVEKLTVTIGEGITGWVARFRVPRHLNHMRTTRARSRSPGRRCCSAPMVHEGVCLGVVVLSKQGLRQFTEDDLRLMVIYASFAGQAMAERADATAAAAEQVERPRAAAACPARAPVNYPGDPDDAGPAGGAGRGSPCPAGP